MGNKGSIFGIFNKILLKFFSVTKLELQKLILGGTLFFFVLGSYSILKELQEVIFSVLVGYKKIPAAKFLTLTLLIPSVFVDAFLADRMRRSTLFIFYLGVWTFLGILLGIGLPISKISLSNPIESITGLDRFFIWFFYVFVEGYPIFLLSTFWSFLNSISNPRSAEKTYGFVVSSSKFGGMVTAGFSYLFLKGSISFGIVGIANKIQFLFFLGVLLLGSALVLLLLYIKYANQEVFVGYKNLSIISEKVVKTGIFSGIKYLFKDRYVLVIFMLVFCSDAINEVINYQRILILFSGEKKIGHSVDGELSDIAAMAFSHIFGLQLMAFMISFFLTNGVMRFLGVRLSIFIMPILAIGGVTMYLLTGKAQFIIYLYITMHALNYSIGIPIRESLFIITNRDVQLKSKFTIDALAVKTSRALSHAFNHLNINYVATTFGRTAMMAANNVFMFGFCGLWLFVAYIGGKMYQNSEAVTRKH